MDDKRTDHRLRSFLKGRVIFNGGQTSLDCLIRDISSGGARLELSASVTLPDRFDLYLPHRESTCKAHIQWRRGSQLGVALETAESAPPMPTVPQDVALRLQQLEAEAALMRMLLTQMRAELDSVKAEKGPLTERKRGLGAA
jgi:PilZ domain